MRGLLKNLPWLLGALLIVAFLIYGFWPKPIGVDIVSVTRGSLIVTVDDDGETRIREKYLIAAPIAGKLLRVTLHPGDTVQRDQTELMEIFPADPVLLDARTQAEAEARVRAAEAACEEAEASLANAREAAKLANHRFERASDLHQSNSISAAEFEEAEHQNRIAEAFVRAAEFRSKMKVFDKEQALAVLLRVTDGTDKHGGTMKIRAPIDGWVLRVLHEDSSPVTAGTSILEIGDLRDMELKIDVLSVAAVDIRPGAKVLVEHWGGQQALHGVVRVVEPSAFLKVSALGVEEKRVNVIIDLVEPWEERKTLGDGFRVEAKIVIRSTAADSLKVASGTLFRHEEDWCVYRIRNNRAELVKVSIGETNGQETEICNGVNESDVLIVYPNHQVRDGVFVIENKPIRNK